MCSRMSTTSYQLVSKLSPEQARTPRRWQRPSPRDRSGTSRGSDRRLHRDRAGTIRRRAEGTFVAVSLTAGQRNAVILEQCSPQCKGDVKRARAPTTRKHDGQTEPLLWIPQILAHVPSLQHIAPEEPQRVELGDHRPDGEPPLFEEIKVLACELRRREAILARTGAGGMP
jgi:hypothetical protein